MKQVNPKYYLVAAGLCLLLLIGAIYHCYMADFSNSDETQYLYIDNNDTPQTIQAKLKPMVTNAGLMAFNTLVRFSNYGKHIKTGRYAIEPNTSAIATFKNIKNGACPAGFGRWCRQGLGRHNGHRFAPPEQRSKCLASSIFCQPPD